MAWFRTTWQLLRYVIEWFQVLEEKNGFEQNEKKNKHKVLKKKYKLVKIPAEMVIFLD